VKAGEKSTKAAAKKLKNPAFSAILKWANGNAAALGVLIAALTLLVGYYAIVCANEGSAEAHRDAVQAHADAHEQLLATEKLDAEIQRLNALSEQQAKRQQPRARKPKAVRQQTPKAGARGNRLERRKTAKFQRQSRSKL
jgi:hypothetical protein